MHAPFVKFFPIKLLRYTVLWQLRYDIHVIYMYAHRRVEEEYDMLVQHEQQQITSRGYQPKVSSEVTVSVDLICSFV